MERPTELTKALDKIATLEMELKDEKERNEALLERNAELNRKLWQLKNVGPW